MINQNDIKKTKVLFFAVFVISFLISCSTISSGKKYTLAKVNRNKQLIEPNKLIIENSATPDYLDKINPTDAFRLVLNSGYLPYLQEVGRPEVAIFVTAKIQSKTQSGESLIWERVYLNSEAEGTHLVVNKDSFLPRKDITVLPAILYKGQEIIISIRVIEMDQEDNARMQELVAVAAAAAATFQPQYAGAISIFQNVLNFIISSNTDDIEFQYDFMLSQSLAPNYSIKKPEQRYDMVLNPRIGTYAVIKTEHRERPVIPYGYADTAQNGLRYGIAEILKFGTLGVLNWTVWCDDVFPCKNMNLKEQDDIYHKILGRPFAPVKASFIPPTYENGLLVPKGDQEGVFQIEGGNIKINPTSISTSEHNDIKLLDYEDQAYLLFSIVPDITGVSVETLQNIEGMSSLIKGLNIRTRQLSAKEIKQSLEPVLTAVEGFVTERNIREKCTALINTAKEEKQVIKAKEECEKMIADIKDDRESEIFKLAKVNIKSDLNSLADRRIDFLKMENPAAP